MEVFNWLRRKDARKSAAPVKPANPYAAVEVCPANGAACAAAREIAGKRFLVAKVPRLPLHGCDREQCACSYKRHKDRRGGIRRYSEFGLQLAGKSSANAEDRRSAVRRGRRKSDGSWVAPGDWHAEYGRVSFSRPYPAQGHHP